MWLRVPSSTDSPGAAQPGREGLGIDPRAGRSPASKEGICDSLCCDADAPWGLRQGQWPGLQHQEQPVSG